MHARQVDADAGSLRQVDASKKLYASLVSLCRWYFAKESMLAACSLRSQLQLAFFESKLLVGGGATLDVASADRCFELTRDLDSCLKVRVLSPGALCVTPRLTAPCLFTKDGYFDQERLVRICGIVERCERAVETAAPVRKTMTVRLNAQVVGPVNSDNSNGGESISVPKDTPVTMLADAAMVLRDTPVFHMLLHETVRPLPRTLCRQVGC